MRKQRIEYDSPVDALVTIAKRLSVYEARYQMTSEDFFDKFNKGQLDDSEDFIEWADGWWLMACGGWVLADGWWLVGDGLWVLADS